MDALFQPKPMQVQRRSSTVDYRLSTLDFPKAPSRFTGRVSNFCPAVEWSATTGR
jgi:hypothetical protein